MKPRRRLAVSDEVAERFARIDADMLEPLRDSASAPADFICTSSTTIGLTSTGLTRIGLTSTGFDQHRPPAPDASHSLCGGGTDHGPACSHGPSTARAAPSPRVSLTVIAPVALPASPGRPGWFGPVWQANQAFAATHVSVTPPAAAGIRIGYLFVQAVPWLPCPPTAGRRLGTGR